MRRPGWITLRWPRGKTAGLLAIVVVASLTTAASPAGAEPRTDPVRAQSSNDFLGDGHGARDVDNRAGAVTPTAQQRSLAGTFGKVRFNALGTPHALGPMPAGR